ncbi:hypothetical protein EI94DRAFT_1753954, partial [Lactarius quietus]
MLSSSPVFDVLALTSALALVIKKGTFSRKKGPRTSELHHGIRRWSLSIAWRIGWFGIIGIYGTVSQESITI